MVGSPKGVRRALGVALAAVTAALSPVILTASPAAALDGPVGRLEILLPEGPADPSVTRRVSVVPLDGSEPVPVDPASVPAGASSGDVVALADPPADPDALHRVERVVAEDQEAPTTGARDLLLVPVTWAGANPLPAKAAMEASLADTAEWYADASHGQLTFGATTIAPVAVLPGFLDFCRAISQAEVAAPVDPVVRTNGIEPDSFDDIIYLLPQVGSCGWLGMAEFDGPRVMMNGQIRPEILIHEIGHSLGLTHSDYLHCVDEAFDTYESLPPIAERNDRCFSIVYGDEFSAMGNATSGSFTGHQLRELGWLAPEAVAAAVTAESTTCLAPLASDAGVRLLEVPIDGAGTVLVENRRAVGVDARVLEVPEIAARDWQGIQLRVVTDVVPRYSGAPWFEPHRIAPHAERLSLSEDPQQDIRLAAGDPWAWGSGVTIEAGEPQPSGCTPVTVRNAAMPAVPAAPTGVVALPGPAQASVGWTAPAGQSFPVASYTVTAMPGGHTCTTTTTSCTVTGLTNGTAHTFTVVATNAKGNGPASVASAPVTPSAGSRYHPLTPTRIADSRPTSKVGPHRGPLGGGASRVIAVRGEGGVPQDADTVVANVTVTGATSASFLTVWPSGPAGPPTASSLSWVAGETVSNAVTVKLGTDGAIKVFNLSGSAHVIVDVVGYFSSTGGAGFTPRPPARLTDSRPNGPNVGPYATPWGPGGERRVTVGGTPSVPAGADAVVLNVTVTATTADSYLVAWPAGQARPVASTVGWKAGETRAAAVTVKLGDLDAVAIYNLAGTAHVVIDVVGYYDEGSGGSFFPLDPIRVQDSRPPGIGLIDASWYWNESRPVLAQHAGPVRLPAAALALNVTVTGTTNASFLTVWPADRARPVASSLNWGPGDTRANAVTVATGVDRSGYDGSVYAYNLAGEAHVIADLAGWYG